MNRLWYVLTKPLPSIHFEFIGGKAAEYRSLGENSIWINTALMNIPFSLLNIFMSLIHEFVHWTQRGLDGEEYWLPYKRYEAELEAYKVSHKVGHALGLSSMHGSPEEGAIRSLQPLISFHLRPLTLRNTYIGAHFVGNGQPDFEFPALDDMQ